MALIKLTNPVDPILDVYGVDGSEWKRVDLLNTSDVQDVLGFVADGRAIFLPFAQIKRWELYERE